MGGMGMGGSLVFVCTPAIHAYSHVHTYGHMHAASTEIHMSTYTRHPAYSIPYYQSTAPWGMRHGRHKA